MSANTSGFKILSEKWTIFLEKIIWQKTTSGWIEWPFYVSDNDQFAIQQSNNIVLI